MARRIYLHIGVMKSATSYLQGLCEQNQAQLAAAGLYWCPDDLRYQAVKELLGKARGTPNDEKDWAHLVAGLRGHPGDALLSNELLAGMGTRQVRRVVRSLPDAEVSLVITARDLARIIPSHWQTTIKNGKTWTWSEFSSAVCSGLPAETAGAGVDQGEGTAGDTLGANAWFWRRHDLPTIVGRWVQVVPIERMTLVTVPSGSSDLAAVGERFCSVLGVDAAGLDPPDTGGNPTLGAHSVELLRRLNGPMAQTELDDPDHRFERALGGALAAQADLEPRFALTQSQQDWVRQRAQLMVGEVERLGVTVVGDLADLIPASSPPSDSVDPGDTTDAELLAAAARGLVGLAPVFNDLRMERNDLRRAVSASPHRTEHVETAVRPRSPGAAPRNKFWLSVRKARERWTGERG